jgi:hypothetical protein
VTFPAGSITGGPVVQTSRSGPTYPAAAPTVQRESTTSSPASAASSAGSPAGAGAKVGHSERELDDLARQLFGRIRTRLRADLLHDREASGFTFDNV